MELSNDVYLGHVSIEVTDLAKARRFYDRLLPVLGFSRIRPISPSWLGYRKAETTIWITVRHTKRVIRQPPHIPADGADDPISDHLGFRAPSSKRVADFESALRGRGLKPLYSTGREKVSGEKWYTSNAWIDPDYDVLEIYALTRK
jgi:catechol 2,3-dioxygenase-like lactoylglutathione lyase family enzyme